MKKKLNNYSHIVGIGEYDDWSYCADTDMWYEDDKEILPLPSTQSELTANLYCEIKPDYDIYCGDAWDTASPCKELEQFIGYLFDNCICCSYDCLTNAVLLRTARQETALCLNEYGIWDLEQFLNKIKKHPFSAQYIEQGTGCKLFAWTANNKTRFAIYSYNRAYKYLEIIFDITADTDLLIKQLTAIVDKWKEILYKAIKEYQKLSAEMLAVPPKDNAIAHFFPDLFPPKQP